jgi:SAM-dependent methyltransferase
MKIKRKVPKIEKVIKIDIGCGKNKREGFTGIDIIDFEGVDIVMNAGKEKWPFKDGSVDEVHASHFVEHLEPMERVHFVNELYRVLKPVEYNNAGGMAKGFATVIVPHWASQRAYGDLTHKWPAVSEFWFYYLDKDWRAVNAPHNDFYKCNLVVNWGYSMHPEIQSRNSEYQQNAMKFWKEACSDMIATLIKK